MQNWCVKQDDVRKATLLLHGELRPLCIQHSAGHGIIEGDIAFHREIFHIGSQLSRPDHALNNCNRSQAGEEINIIVTQAT